MNNVAQLRSAFCTLIARDDEREADINDAQEYADIFERVGQALSLDMALMPGDAVKDLNARLNEGAKLHPGALFVEGVRAASEIIDDLF